MKLWEVFKALDEGKRVQFRFVEEYAWLDMCELTGFSIEMAKRFEFRVIE